MSVRGAFPLFLRAPLLCRGCIPPQTESSCRSHVELRVGLCQRASLGGLRNASVAACCRPTREQYEQVRVAAIGDACGSRGRARGDRLRGRKKKRAGSSRRPVKVEQLLNPRGAPSSFLVPMCPSSLHRQANHLEASRWKHQFETRVCVQRWSLALTTQLYEARVAPSPGHGS
jgi:hypothetical protein